MSAGAQLTEEVQRAILVAKGIIVVAGTTAVTLLARRLASAISSFLVQYAAVRAALRSIESMSASAQAQLQRLAQQRQQRQPAASARAPQQGSQPSQSRGAGLLPHSVGDAGAHAAGLLDFFSPRKPRPAQSDTSGSSGGSSRADLPSHSSAFYGAEEGSSLSPDLSGHNAYTAAPSSTQPSMRNGTGHPAPPPQASQQLNNAAWALPGATIPPPSPLPPHIESDDVQATARPPHQQSDDAEQQAGSNAALQQGEGGGSDGVMWRKHSGASSAKQRRPAWATAGSASKESAGAPAQASKRSGGRTLTFKESQPSAADESGSDSSSDNLQGPSRSVAGSASHVMHNRMHNGTLQPGTEAHPKLQRGMPGADPWLDPAPKAAATRGRASVSSMTAAQCY